MHRWSFAKGHGTENDFVLLLDREGLLDVTPQLVRRICDRHAGVGGDGLLRAVLARHVPEWTGDGDLWFMDYRNADGSVAEMCGNGVRVFVRHLLDQGLALGPVVDVATRAGLREATALLDGRIRVAMGPVRLTEASVEVRTADGSIFRARGVDVGNPHAVSVLEEPADLEALDLHRAPNWAPRSPFPCGVNLEFVHPLADFHIAMRVFERGSGETRSCGTGTVAAVAAVEARRRSLSAGRLGIDETDRVTYRVDVPGGSVEVELADQAYLTGPAVIVAHGEATLAL